MCRSLAGVLARKRPSPLGSGKSETWAAAIVRVIGWVNFLDDSSQSPHLKLTVIDQAFGISSGTGRRNPRRSVTCSRSAPSTRNGRCPARWPRTRWPG